MKRIAAGGLALVVLAVAGVFIFFNFIRDDAPEAFGLTETTQQADDDQGDGGGSADTSDGSNDQTGADATGADQPGADDAATDEPAGETATADDGEPPSIDGTWSVAAGSEAGYRVVEDLGSIQDFEAVGRTTEITGSVDIGGTTITAASFEVDVATITSDDDRRDGQFRGDVMNSTEFPTATLVLTEPIELGSIPSAGTQVSTDATGELTLRGASNAVTFPIEAQLLGDQIEIVGSIDVLFSDYGIDNPSNPFVSVRDEGKVEVRLLLDNG
ncbi:MAG: YceI family protein [Acidimicrobiales bacterium]